MGTHSPRRRSALMIFVLLVAAATAIFASGSAIAATKSRHHRPHHHHKHKRSLSGKWSGSYSGRYSGTFTLHWTQSGSHLSGSITLSEPSGTYGVSGSVHGRHIGFGAVSAGATYTGSVKPGRRSMSGTYKTKKGSGTWTAHKT